MITFLFWGDTLDLHSYMLVQYLNDPKSEETDFSNFRPPYADNRFGQVCVRFHSAGDEYSNLERRHRSNLG
ncbi:MAG: hypothetical protein R3C03_09995 [Pirellulaceae bacterium]